MDKNDIIKNNTLYNNVKKYDSYYTLEELFLSLLIIKETKNTFEPGLLWLIKELKDMTGFGLKELKEFTDIMKSLSLINTKTYEISDDVNLINNVKQIIYMFDNNLTINYLVKSTLFNF
jgi:hypothetical protein